MWIRTQNKKKLVKIDEIWLYEKIINAESTTGTIVLGNYSTEERAIEVLNKIQTFINNYGFSVATSEDCAKVFNMPKE